MGRKPTTEEKRTLMRIANTLMDGMEPPRGPPPRRYTLPNRHEPRRGRAHDAAHFNTLPDRYEPPGGRAHSPPARGGVTKRLSPLIYVRRETMKRVPTGAPSIYQMSPIRAIDQPQMERHLHTGRNKCGNCGQRGHYKEDCRKPPDYKRCTHCGLRMTGRDHTCPY